MRGSADGVFAEVVGAGIAFCHHRGSWMLPEGGHSDTEFFGLDQGGVGSIHGADWSIRHNF